MCSTRAQLCAKTFLAPFAANGESGKKRIDELNKTSKSKLQELEALDPARLEKVITLCKWNKGLTANEPKIAQWLENKPEQFKCLQGGAVHRSGTEITALEIAALDKIDARLLQPRPRDRLSLY